MSETTGASRQAANMADLREATGTQANPAADVLRVEIVRLDGEIGYREGMVQRYQADAVNLKVHQEALDAAEARRASLQEALKLITKGESDG